MGLSNLKKRKKRNTLLTLFKLIDQPFKKCPTFIHLCGHQVTHVSGSGLEMTRPGEGRHLHCSCVIIGFFIEEMSSGGVGVESLSKKI